MKHNFNSGPCILPTTVYEQASQAILNFNNSGLSILEIGHRTPLFQQVLDEAIITLKELMQLDADHEVLFMHGGASTQFMQVPMNLLDTNSTAAYIDCGGFGNKALKEAKFFGNVHIVASSKEAKYTYIPKDYEVPANCAYFHITSNNTIEGNQHKQIPNTTVPLVADMSSDILSRQMDFNRFDLIYAGAQKNIGAAGVNIVIVNKNALGKISRPIPNIMDYRQHIANGSMLNTPPVFAVYVCMLTLRWLKQLGGVGVIEKTNLQKANMVYNALDTLPVFTPTVAKEDRSTMNAVWIMQNEVLEQEFLEECKNAGIVGIKGHRSVGGFRASLYNALPVSSVQVLVDLMTDFAERKG
jgi:phosphoserine aminotransferase